MSEKKITANDFEKIIAEEIENGNGYNAFVRCFALAEKMSKQTMINEILDAQANKPNKDELISRNEIQVEIEGCFKNGITSPHQLAKYIYDFIELYFKYYREQQKETPSDENT